VGLSPIDVHNDRSGSGRLREKPSPSPCLRNRASLYDDKGRYADAESLINRSLVIYEKALGPEHPSVSISLGNLALLYDKQVGYADALEWMRRGTANLCTASQPKACRRVKVF
jgi:tetratricopeptide (TPR) repeat protein